MMVLIHATGPFPDIQFLGPEWDGIRVFAVGELQDFSSCLFRDPDAIAILHCHLPDMAAQIVRGMRHGNVGSRLMVLLRERNNSRWASEVDSSLVAGSGFLLDRSWAGSGVRARVLVAGADDAQPDTIDPRELVARLRALSVRTREIVDLLTLTPTVALDLRYGELVSNGTVVHLTKHEALLLELIAARQGACVTKAQCMAALYGGRDEAQVKIVDVLLCKLRRKLRTVCGDQRVIETVWSRGYRFVGAAQ